MVTLSKVDGLFGFGLRTLNDKEPRVGEVIAMTAAAQNSDLRVGDHIISINGIPTTSGTHADLLLALGTYNKVQLLVRSNEHYERYLQSFAVLQPESSAAGRTPASASGSTSLDGSSTAFPIATFQFEVDLVRGPTGYDLALCSPTPRGRSTKRQPHQVFEVQPNGVADRAGLCVGDAFVAVDGRSVTNHSHEDFQEVLMRVKQGQAIRVAVKRSFELLRHRLSATRSQTQFSLGAVTESTQRRRVYVEGAGTPSTDTAIPFDMVYSQSPSIQWDDGHAADETTPTGATPTGDDPALQPYDPHTIPQQHSGSDAAASTASAIDHRWYDQVSTPTNDVDVFLQ